MAETIFAYLAEVEGRLAGTVDDDALQEILRETEGHLRDSTAEIQGLGLSRQEAEREAVRHFGEASPYVEGLAEQTPTIGWAARYGLAKWTVIVATISVLLWPLLVQDYPTYTDQALGALRWSVVPACALAVAALFGSRVRVRTVFGTALAGGFVLLLILTTRFVGSNNSGGVVVRSLALRSSIKSDYGACIAVMQHRDQRLASLDATAILGVPTLRPSELEPLRERLRDERDTARRWALGHAEHLHESFFQRLMGDASYVPVFAISWTLFLLALQALGHGTRRVLLKIGSRLPYRIVRVPAEVARG